MSNVLAREAASAATEAVMLLVGCWKRMLEAQAGQQLLDLCLKENRSLKGESQF